MAAQSPPDPESLIGGWIARQLPLYRPGDPVLAAWSAEELAAAIAAQCPFGEHDAITNAVLRAVHGGGVVVHLDDWPPPGWLPCRWQDESKSGEARLDWIYLPDTRSNDAFYDDSCRHAQLYAINRLVRYQTSISGLLAGRASHPTVPLRGLVYHMSRCGSTLVAQMLGAPDRHLIFAEPDPLDGLLHRVADGRVTVVQAIPALQALVAAFGHGTMDRADNLFIKLDAWHTAHIPLLRAAFPDVPWVYLFRDPVAVMVSHRRLPGRHTVARLSGDSVLSSVSPAIASESVAPEAFTANVLAAIGQSVIDHWAVGGGMLMPYDALGEDSVAALFIHFHVPLGDDALAKVRDLRAFDVKSPQNAFVADSEAKRRAATPAILHYANSLLLPLHRHLCAMARQRDDADPLP